MLHAKNRDAQMVHALQFLGGPGFDTRSDNILSFLLGGGRVVRWYWVNFQCRGVLLVWLRVGQGPTVLAVGADGGCLDIFTLIYPFSSLSPSLWETTRYRLKYCLKGSLSPKTTNQQNRFSFRFFKKGSCQLLAKVCARSTG